MLNVKRRTEKLRKSFKRTFGWLVLASGLLLLLFYGLSFFVARPTVETITTHAPVRNTQNVKYGQSQNR